MTAQRAVWLVCDVCEQDSSGNLGGAGETVQAARADARRNGWHHRPDGRDVCPSCWDEGHR